MIDLVFQNLTVGSKFKEDFFKKILETAVVELGLKENGVGVSLNLVGEDKIIELNKKYRRKDKATDVLSFPLKDALEIGNWKLEITKSNVTTFDLGDIFICLPFA